MCAATGEPRVAGELCATDIRAADDLCTSKLRGIKLCAGIELRIGSLHLPKHQEDVVLKTYVARVCCVSGVSYACWKYLMWMFQK